MRGKDNRPVGWAILDFLDKDRAKLFQTRDDMGVVDDLMTDIDRRAPFFDGFLRRKNLLERREESSAEMRAFGRASRL